MGGSPAVTVLMPLYNSAPWVGEAIQSILSQTFSDFELLVINDGSTDRSAEVVRAISDPRIRLVENESNIGLIATLNRGTELARGDLIARLDSDDVAELRRLEWQTAFLAAHPEVAVLGGDTRFFGGVSGRGRYPAHPDEVRATLLFDTAFAHPTVMMRRSLFVDHGVRYPAELVHAEDYGLWCRLTELGFRMANLPHVLVRYRCHGQQVGAKYSADQFKNANLLRRRQLSQLGIEPTDQELAVHAALGKGIWDGVQCTFRDVSRWCDQLLAANERVKWVSPKALRRVVARKRLACLLKRARARQEIGLTVLAGMMRDREVFWDEFTWRRLF